MFSKSRINEPGPKTSDDTAAKTPDVPPARATTDFTPSAPKAKPPASTLSSDLTITGNLKTTGDIQVEGVVEGDIRAHLLTVGEGATIKGEVVADDVVVNGRIVGKVRGLKVRLTSTARVEGDIIHKT
ncbi:MAG: polymer-forming cytoskeletal protein, partial [Rhodobacter sp.]|nr:polymer-forming cytoskeletal protein [Rhodobacter sp.]